MKANSLQQSSLQLKIASRALYRPVGLDEKQCTEIHIGRHLREWRLQQGLTQDGAARMLGVAASTWGHWETGKRLPTPRLLLLLRDMSGMSIGYLMCENSDHCPFQMEQRCLP